MTNKTLISALINLIFAFFAYLWVVHGSEGAGRVFLFILWFVGLMGMIKLFVPVSKEGYTPSTKIGGFLSAFFGLGFVFTAVWAGHVVAASVYAVGCCMFYAHNDLCKDAACRQDRI